MSDPFAGLRWEWEQLAVEQRREAVHAMQDALRLFTRGEVRRGHHLAKTKAQ